MRCSFGLLAAGLLGCASERAPRHSVDAESWLLSTDLEVTHLTADAYGNAYVSGGLLDTGALAGLSVEPTEGYIWLGRLLGDGSADWAHSTSIEQSISGLALDGESQVWMGGAFRGDIALGRGLTATSAAGDDDALAAAWDARGREQALFSRGAAGQDNVWSLSGWAEGVVVGGWQYDAAEASWDVWLASLDRKGEPLWEHRFGTGDGASQSVILLATNSSGEALVVGNTERGLALQAFPVAEGMWLARLDAQGDVLWARNTTDPITAVVLDEDGGGWVRTIQGGMYWSDWTITRIDPDGEELWRWTCSGQSMVLSSPMEATASGELWFAGSARSLDGDTSMDAPFAPFVGGLSADGQWLDGRIFAEGVENEWMWSYAGVPLFALGAEGQVLIGGPLYGPVEIDGQRVEEGVSFLASILFP